VFESAERRLLIVKHAVDRYSAGLNLRRHAARALYVGPAHEGVEAEARVVGDPDRIFLGFTGDNREHGPKNLFLSDGYIVLHIDKHGGLHEVTSLKPFWITRAADQDFRAFFNAFETNRDKVSEWSCGI
jgi:hypothetical protein